MVKLICVYDGSFEGLLNVVFETYSIPEEITIFKSDEQLDFFDSKVEIKTDTDKYNRVKKSIIKNFSNKFFVEVYCCFLSNHDKKDEVILNVLRNIFRLGYTYINSPEKNAVLFNRLVKKVSGEAHAYKGLLRFREVQEGFLLAEFEPENEILEIITNHFIKRMPNEKFIICNRRSNRCSVYFEKECKFFDVLDLNICEAADERVYREAWKLFYSTVVIKERENKKLMQSNMPKKRWKYLTERN